MHKALCAGCGHRHARFRLRRRWNGRGSGHTLCSRCWGAEVDRQRANNLTAR